MKVNPMKDKHRQDIVAGFVAIASEFCPKTALEDDYFHSEVVKNYDSDRAFHAEFYKIAEKVREEILKIKDIDTNESKDSLYEQINSKASVAFKDYENPVILWAHGRYNRACQEMSGQDVYEDYGSGGHDDLPGSNKGNQRWSDSGWEGEDCLDVLKTDSDIYKLFEEVGHKTDDCYLTVTFIYWNPKTKKIAFKNIDPSGY